MDPERFDTLARTLSHAQRRSRRGVLRTVMGGVLVGLWGAVRGSVSTQAQVPPALCPEWVLARYPWLCEGNEPNTNNRNDDDDNDDDDKKDKDKKNDGDGCTSDCTGKGCGAANGCGGVCGCPTGQDCLSGGICATPCGADPTVCTSCGLCQDALNGQRYCTERREVESCDQGTCTYAGELCASDRRCYPFCNP